MRREYYNYIKESVKNNLNKKLLNEDWGGLGMPGENTPPHQWRRRSDAPFANKNPAANQPTFVDPGSQPPPSTPAPGLGGGSPQAPDKSSPEYMWQWDENAHIWRKFRKFDYVNMPDGERIFYYGEITQSMEPKMGQVFWNPVTGRWEQWRGFGDSIGRWQAWSRGMWP